jgi:site-specific DNA-methyltransferase (adenine-specific)
VKKYFQNEWVTLYHGDCLEVLPRLPASSIGCVITDPPYGVNYESTWRKESFGVIAGDKSQDVAVLALRECQRVLQNKAHVYTFGQYDLTGLNYTAPVELIWDKGTQSVGNLNCPWGPAHEYIQFRVFNNSKQNIANGEGNLTAKMRKGSVLHVPAIRGGSATRHPTEKPVQLLRELIESSSRFGDTILDFFGGVGSTAVAAMLEGRKCILIELEERYLEIAARRLSQSVLPLEFEVAA